MNLLFLTLSQFESIDEHGIYPDLLREFAKNGHKVYAISPVEKRQGKETHINRTENATVLRLQIGNTQKTNIIEKGISTVLIEPIYKKAIRKYFSDVKFDLILYSTPPITLVSAIEYVKKRDNAKTYLLLKDIFPQNAVDLGMMSTKGLKGLLYRYFRKKEKRLYSISDQIGCMSQANVDYVLSNNPEVKSNNVEVCPNAIEVIDKSIGEEEKKQIRKKYHIPYDRTVFVYGGNLGKPQDIPFVIKCIDKCKEIENAFFLIIGDGTEYPLLEKYVSINNPNNMKLMRSLPKEDYDSMVGACDVGLLFLDHRFTIPNFPSRILSYMAAKMPVLACTDKNTDIGKVVVEGGFGWWCESSDADCFKDCIEQIHQDRLLSMGKKAYAYIEENYNCELACEVITKSI